MKARPIGDRERADRARTRYSYLLACSQPWVNITDAVHAIVYRWCRMNGREVSQRGRYLVCGSFKSFEAVVDDFGTLVRVTQGAQQ